MHAELMRKRIRTAAICIGLAAVGHLLLGASTQAQEGFPQGYDAVQAAPDSHRVILENALVRVLEVSVPHAGESEPMHHHRWPGFFVDWDVGGRTNHLRYHRPDGSVKEIPSADAPKHPGVWRVKWTAPEPMHAIETVEKNSDATELRVEIKLGR
jgi:hypothetical protein